MMAKVHHRNGNEQVVIALGQKSDGSISAAMKTVQDQLAAFGVQIDDSIQEIFDEVGKEAVKMLKATSPVNEKSPQKGRYAKGWKYERGKKVRGVTMSYVRNAKDPQLTHLLEFGHPIVRNGVTVGNADPIPHIAPVAEWVAEEANKRIQKSIGGN
jgi:hypothetical protein